MKKALKTILIVLVIIVSLFFAQRILVPKYIAKNEEGRLVAEYYNASSDNDVIFIGDCEVYSNFSPIKLWQDYGITSYIRGNPQQLIWQSYYILEDTLRYETPKVVIFNVLSMKYAVPQNEAYNRLALDGLKWSKTKLDSIKASMTEEESVISYVFPIIRFHSRWNEITSEDFKYMFSTEQLSHNGYVMRVDTKPVKVIPTPEKLPDYSFSDTCWGYLDKMRTLCEENGIKFILIKAPTLYPAWYDQWEAQIEEYAAKYGLDYINFLELQDETGIDYQQDTFDAGMHMNLSGAEKLSAWMGKYLSEKVGVTDRRSEAPLVENWNKKITFYEEMKASQYKQLEETGSITHF